MELMEAGSSGTWRSAASKEAMVATMEAVLSNFFTLVAEKKMCTPTLEAVLATQEGVIATIRAAAREADLRDFVGSLTLAMSNAEAMTPCCTGLPDRTASPRSRAAETMVPVKDVWEEKQKQPMSLTNELEDCAVSKDQSNAADGQRAIADTIEKALASEVAVMQQSLEASIERGLLLLAKNLEATKDVGKVGVSEKKWRHTSNVIAIAAPDCNDQDEEIFPCTYPELLKAPSVAVPPARPPDFAEALSEFDEPLPPHGEPAVLEVPITVRCTAETLTRTRVSLPGTLPGDESPDSAAKLELPGATHFEKDFSTCNSEGASERADLRVPTDKTPGGSSICGRPRSGSKSVTFVDGSPKARSMHHARTSSLSSDNMFGTASITQDEPQRNPSKQSNATSGQLEGRRFGAAFTWQTTTHSRRTSSASDPVVEGASDRFAAMTFDRALGRRSQIPNFEVLECWTAATSSKMMAAFGGKHSKDFVTSNRPWIEDDDEHEKIDKLLQAVHTDRCQALMIHPNSLKRAAWDLISLVFVIYDMIMVPMTTFPLETSTFTDVVDWSTRIFWTLDMPLSFTTGAILQDGTIEMRSTVIAWRYLRTWFLLDCIIVTTDWLEAILATSGAISYARVGKGSRIFRIIRLVRLMRLLRMGEVIKLLTERIHSEAFIIMADCAKIMVAILFIAHVFACCWYGVGNASDGRTWLNAHKEYSGSEGSTLGYRYTSSLHWAFLQFGGGTDEVVCQNIWERIYSILVWILAYIIACIFVSRLTSSMTRLQMLGNKQTQQLYSLRKYLAQARISRRLALRVSRNAQHALREQYRHIPESKVSLLELVSDPLRVELHFEMYSPVLQVHPFFRQYILECPQVMRKVCHMATSTCVIAPGDILFHAGETFSSPKMYIVMSGTLQYTPIWGDVQEVGDHCWVAEAVLWTQWVHQGNLKAHGTYCRLCMLDANQFQAIATKFNHPDFDPHRYAVSFVEALNENEEDLSDLPANPEAWDFNKPRRHASGYGLQATNVGDTIAAILHLDHGKNRLKHLNTAGYLVRSPS